MNFRSTVAKFLNFFAQIPIEKHRLTKLFFPSGILAPTARSVTKTKTVEWNLNSPLVWVTSLRFETAIAGILRDQHRPSGKVAGDSRIRGVTKLKWNFCNGFTTIGSYIWDPLN